jgi:hypothetical protein
MLVPHLSGEVLQGRNPPPDSFLAASGGDALGQLVRGGWPCAGNGGVEAAKPASPAPLLPVVLPPVEAHDSGALLALHSNGKAAHVAAL